MENTQQNKFAIFIDIDGVMQSDRVMVSNGMECSFGGRYSKYSFDQVAVNFLNLVAQVKGADLILNSTWAVNMTQDELKLLAKVTGLDLVGFVPDDMVDKGEGSRQRRSERFLDANPHYTSALYIDDEEKLYSTVDERNLVIVNQANGITYARMEEILKKLDLTTDHLRGVQPTLGHSPASWADVQDGRNLEDILFPPISPKARQLVTVNMVESRPSLQTFLDETESNTKSINASSSSIGKLFFAERQRLLEESYFNSDNTVEVEIDLTGVDMVAMSNRLSDRSTDIWATAALNINSALKEKGLNAVADLTTSQKIDADTRSYRAILHTESGMEVIKVIVSIIFRQSYGKADLIRIFDTGRGRVLEKAIEHIASLVPKELVIDTFQGTRTFRHLPGNYDAANEAFVYTCNGELNGFTFDYIQDVLRGASRTPER